MQLSLCLVAVRFYQERMDQGAKRYAVRVALGNLRCDKLSSELIKDRVDQGAKWPVAHVYYRKVMCFTQTISDQFTNIIEKKDVKTTFYFFIKSLNRNKLKKKNSTKNKQFL